jgi:hypothetical protein
MELHWRQNHPQEIIGIELGRNTWREDIYNDKITWLAWEMRLAKGVNIFDMPQKAT